MTVKIGTNRPSIYLLNDLMTSTLHYTLCFTWVNSASSFWT